MSKHPSPRVDQLRALREAKFARNEERQKQAAKAAEPVKSTPEKPKAEKPDVKKSKAEKSKPKTSKAKKKAGG